MRKKFISIILVLALVCLVGCSSNSTKDKEQKGVDSLDEVSIVLDWYPNAVHSFLYAADSLGYYKDEGIKVKILFPSGTADAITMTAANKVDLGIYYPGDLIKARANENIPVKSIGAVIQQPLNVIISKKSRNITRPKDLEGKTLGTSGDIASEKIIKYLVEGDGGDFSKVKLVDVGFDLLSAITTDKVDATTGNMENHEPPALREAGIDINVMKPYEYNIPMWYEMLFISSEENIKNKSDIYRRFMKATSKGFEYMQAQTDKALEILMQNQQKAEFPLKDAVEKESIKILLPVMKKNGEPFMKQEGKVWDELIAFYKKVGIINNTIPSNEVFTNEFIPK